MLLFPSFSFLRKVALLFLLRAKSLSLPPLPSVTKEREDSNKRERARSSSPFSSSATTTTTTKKSLTIIGATAAPMLYCLIHLSLSVFPAKERERETISHQPYFSYCCRCFWWFARSVSIERGAVCSMPFTIRVHYTHKCRPRGHC